MNEKKLKIELKKRVLSEIKEYKRYYIYFFISGFFLIFGTIILTGFLNLLGLAIFFIFIIIFLFFLGQGFNEKNELKKSRNLLLELEEKDD